MSCGFTPMHQDDDELNRDNFLENSKRLSFPETLMNIFQVVTELKRQLADIDYAILVFERLAAHLEGRRRGRPPKWMAELKEETLKAVVRPPAKKNRAVA